MTTNKTTIGIGERLRATEVSVTQPLSNGQLADISSTLGEIADRKLMPWCKLPDAIHNGGVSTTLVFEQRHFGVFRNAEGEIAARIIQEILETDGEEVALEEEVIELEPSQPVEEVQV